MLVISFHLDYFTRSALEHYIISNLELFGLLAVGWILHVSNIVFFPLYPTSFFGLSDDIDETSSDIIQTCV